MYSRQVLRFLASITILSISCVAVGKGKVDVYTDFQKKVSTLESDLKKEKIVTKRYDQFLKTYKDLSDLRAKNPRQSEDKELNMSFFMDTLSYLPEKKDFQASKCPSYKKEANTMMKSYDKSQKEPFIEKAFNIIDLICN